MQAAVAPGGHAVWEQCEGYLKVLPLKLHRKQSLPQGITLQPMPMKLHTYQPELQGKPAGIRAAHLNKASDTQTVYGGKLRYPCAAYHRAKLYTAASQVQGKKKQDQTASMVQVQFKV